MLGTIGLALTALGTIVAIITPTKYGRIAPENWQELERKLQMRYYTGIGMIVVGTILQIAASWS